MLRRRKGQCNLLGRWVSQTQARSWGSSDGKKWSEKLPDLLVLHDLVVLRLTHIEKLATQREDTKSIAPNITEPGHGECLGGVSFSQYERAFGCIAGSGWFASASLVIPIRLSTMRCGIERIQAHQLCLLPSVFLICQSAMNYTQLNTFSMMEDLDTNANAKLTLTRRL